MRYSKIWIYNGVNCLRKRKIISKWKVEIPPELRIWGSLSPTDVKRKEYTIQLKNWIKEQLKKILWTVLNEIKDM